MIDNILFYNHLSSIILSPRDRIAINIKNEIHSFLINECNQSDMKAFNYVSNNIYNIRKKIENYCQVWENQGIPRPIVETDQTNIYVLWTHKKFNYYYGLNTSIDENFCNMYRLISNTKPVEFLIVCAIWLKVCGFDPIFITDSRGDAGADLIGIIKKGGLKSLISIIQAKTSKNQITSGTIMAEYGKYKMLPNTNKYWDYRDALNVDQNIDGTSWSYMIMANNIFHFESRNVAKKLGILLRSVHQISYTLSKNCKADEVAIQIAELKPNLKADITTNFADRISIC